MIDLPDLDKLEAGTSYTDIFMLKLVWNIGIFGAGIFILFLIFLCLKLYQLHAIKLKQQSRQSLLTYTSGNRQSQQTQTQNRQSNVVISDSQDQVDGQGKKNNKITLFDLVNYITSLTFYLSLMAVAFVYLGFYVFGQLGRGTGHDILAVLIMVCIVALPTILWKTQTKSNKSRITKAEIIFTIVMLAVWAIISIMAVISMKGVCICVFNEKYGTKVQKDFSFSTQFTRMLQIDKVCPDGKICHMYATLAENASDSVFINVHAGSNVENLTVLLTSVGEENQIVQMFNLTNSKPYRMKDIEYIAKRNIFSFYFNTLKPDTLYAVIAKDTTTETVLYRTNYRTLPGEDATQIRFAVGGDVGLDKDASTLTSYLVEYNPHVLLIGGDNAYDDGMRTCFFSWDNFYDIMDELNGKLNRMVPMALTVGNHDVGYNALAGINIDFNNVDDLPYYFLFNPQHRLLGTNDVPDAKDRLSYHYHIIGPTIHVHLDSGYVKDFNSQRLLIEKINNDYSKLYKFANYHNPIYPSCTDDTEGSNDRLVIENGLKYWTPLFDSGKFVAAFEHHTHHRKFTYKIKGNQVQSNKSEGVRYVGDGSWGVPEDACPEHHASPHPEYFQYYQRTHPNHIWKVRLFKTANKTYAIEYKAIDLNNTVVFNATDDLL